MQGADNTRRRQPEASCSAGGVRRLGLLGGVSARKVRHERVALDRKNTGETRLVSLHKRVPHFYRIVDPYAFSQHRVGLPTQHDQGIM